MSIEAPRGSLMESVRHQIFDDLLLCHFARIYLHGLDALFPELVPGVTRWADNGGARSVGEIEALLDTYRRRAALPFLERALGQASAARPRPPTPGANM
jgi:hypothetical protein